MLSPQLWRPTPLAPIATILEKALDEPVRSLSSVPPQYGKTTLIEHGYIMHMLRRPGRKHAYVTYQQQIANTVGHDTFKLAEAAGLKPEGRRSEWRTANGSVFYSAGVETGLTSRAITGLLVFDDPHKNRAEAESSVKRERVHREFTSTIMSRIHATTSVIVNHTRWHVDDLIGRLAKNIARWGARINLCAVNESGEALWPELHPLWQLDEARESEYDWWSLYMGEPRPRGGSLFKDVYFYTERPTKRFRVAIGLDGAYSKRTHSDYCVAVVMAECEGTYYVLDVKREQTRIEDFAATLKQLHAAWPNARWRFDANAQEMGVAALLSQLCGFHIRGELAQADKFVRAQPLAVQWNKGRVLVPEDAPWTSDYVAELGDFTGISDKHDDQVDASASAMLELGPTSTEIPRAFPTGFTHYGDGLAFPGNGGGNGWVWR